MAVRVVCGAITRFELVYRTLYVPRVRWKYRRSIVRVLCPVNNAAVGRSDSRLNDVRAGGVPQRVWSNSVGIEAGG